MKQSKLGDEVDAYFDNKPVKTRIVSPSTETRGYLSNWVALYHEVNKMMLTLGADGEVNATQDEACDVMNALHQIDGGEYDDKMKAR